MGLDSLSDSNDIGLRHMTEVLLADPDPDPGMALREENDRVEAGGLVGRGKEERGIEAGGEPLVRDPTGTANLLTLAFKRGGRFGIGQSEARDGRPDRGSKKVCAARVLRLVAVHRTVVARGLENTRGVLHHACDRRIIRGDERREDLGHVAHPAPLVAGKKIDPARLHDGRHAVGLDSEFELADLRFVETCQAFDIRGRGEVAKRELGFTRNAVDYPDLLANDGRR